MNDTDTPTMEIVAGDSLEHIERASIDMQISTAKRYPRQMTVVKKAMLDLATLDRDTAATCFYTLKRKDKDGDKIIQGPSVRMAEIAVNSFGNIRAGFRIIGNDGKMITAQGICHDLEKNVCITSEVKRRITNRDGKTYSDDMQIVTGNAAGSIALRNAIFKVIPMALIKPVYDAAKKTAVGDAKTLKERRAKMFEAFKEMGVSKERVLGGIGKNGEEEIGLAELEILIGMHTAIVDKEQTIEELFPDVSRPKFTTAEDRARAADNLIGAESPAPKEAPAAENKPADEKPAEQKPADKPVEKPAEAPKAPAEPKAEKKKLSPKTVRALTQIGTLLEKDKIADTDLLAAMREMNFIGKSVQKLEDVYADTLENVIEKWDSVVIKAREIESSK